MNRNTWTNLLKVLLILLSVYLFIVGIRAMGDSFKMFGKDFSTSILKTTSSPFVGLVIGILATALIQSSSTTTSIVVAMVGTDGLSIEAAIPIIMGANIGTSVTNTIVSLGHMTKSDEFRRAFAAATVHDFFNLCTVAILFPLELATGFLSKCATALSGVFVSVGGLKAADPIKIMTAPVNNFIKKLGESLGADGASWIAPTVVLVIGGLLIFCMLIVLVKTLKSLVLDKLEKFFDVVLFRNAGVAMLFGLVLTTIVQSSSITTSLIIPLAGAGLLKLRQILPYTMGANVGTTFTAILAALAKGDAASVTVSFTHLLFNVTGIVIIWPIPVVRQIPVKCAEWLADQACKRWYVPFAFVGLVFFLIPLACVMIFK